MKGMFFAIITSQVRRFFVFLRDTFIQFPSYLRFLVSESFEFSTFFRSYIQKKLVLFSTSFESGKNVVVKGVLIRRGKRNRMFLHMSAMSLLMFGALISPYISSALFSDDELLQVNAFDGTYSLVTENVFETRESEKPRDEVISYTVQKGDTVSTIAEKFGISEDTVRWANDVQGDNIRVGEQVDILPVSGVAHKVKSGDTVYSIAEDYSANPQAVVDFPFNDFADPQTFSLVVGQIVIVPDGVPASEAPSVAPRRKIARGQVEQVGASGFSWPVRGTLNQYFAWYHQGIDIGADIGTPVVASTNGTVAAAYTSGWHGGYGTHVIIEGSNGYTTLYAHLSSLNVGVGQSVSAGSTVVGWIGMTGRTTGPHLHFEVRGGSGFMNPMSVLQ